MLVVTSFSSFVYTKAFNVRPQSSLPTRRALDQEFVDYETPLSTIFGVQVLNIVF
jgi:hypothetical protein